MKRFRFRRRFRSFGRRFRSFSRRRFYPRKKNNTLLIILILGAVGFFFKDKIMSLLKLKTA